MQPRLAPAVGRDGSQHFNIVGEDTGRLAVEDQLKLDRRLQIWDGGATSDGREP